MSEKHILVDWHGPADFNRSFCEIPPNEIDLYFYYTLEIGRRTCRANCAHCFFRKPEVAGQSILIQQAAQITRDLQQQGYNVGLTPADSFSVEVLEANGAAGSAYRVSELGNMAWTSGFLLSQPGWEARLEQGWTAGFRSLVMNGHGVAGIPVPFPGVTTAENIDLAVNNVLTWNQQHPNRQFKLGLTFTIRNDNYGLAHLRQMVQYALAHRVDVVRFNCFANFLQDDRFEQYVLSRKQVEQFYRNLAALHLEFLSQTVKISVSEDFGDAGIEAIRPFMAPEFREARVGECRAGWRLFAIVPQTDELIVVGCVDSLRPTLGKVVQREGRWTIDWEVERIERLARARANGQFYGCFGGLGQSNHSGYNSAAGRTLLTEMG